MTVGRRHSRFRTVLLVAVSGALSILIVHLVRAPLTTTDFAVAATSRPALDAIDLSFEPFVMPSKDEFLVMWERPLFLQSRRRTVAIKPTAPPVKVTRPAKPRPKPTPKLRDLALVGIALIGERRLALLRPSGGKDVIQVVEGEALDGWQVEAIETEAVTFRFGSNKQRIEFPKPANPAASTRAPARLRRQ